MEAGASAEGAKPRLTAATPAGVGHLVLACRRSPGKGSREVSWWGAAEEQRQSQTLAASRQGRRLQEVRGQGSWVLQRDRQASEHG